MASMVWTPTIVHQDRTEHGKKLNQVSLQGSSGTYLAGGISVTGISGGMGLPYGNIEQVVVVDNAGDGYVYQWNRVNNAIQIFQTTSTSAYGTQKLVELTSSVSPSSLITVEVIGW